MMPPKTYLTMLHYTQLSKRNSTLSPLLILPPELLKIIILYIHSPLDLLGFSFTCHELFHFLTSLDWFLLANFTFKNWILSCGGAKDQDWKNILLRDTTFRLRLEQHLPSTSNYHPYSSSAFSPGTLLFNPLKNTTTSIPARLPLRVLLSESQQFPQDLDSESHTWVHTVSPTYSIDNESNTAIAASMTTRPVTSFKSFGTDPRPHEHRILFYNLPDLSRPIAVCERHIWEQDYTSNSTKFPWHHPFTRDMMQVAQVVAIKHFPKHVKKGKFRLIIVIAFGQRSRPLLRQTNLSHALSIWLLLKVIELWIPVQPFALVDTALINHFQRTTPLKPHQVKPCHLIDLSDITNVESLEPRQHQITMRGYVVKLFTAEGPQPPLKSTSTTFKRQQSTKTIRRRKSNQVDCIAVFGIQYSDIASAMVIKKILFKTGNNNISHSTYSNKAYSVRVSSLTLFPDNSGYERMLVLINHHGRDVIWDWVNEKKVIGLNLPIDRKVTNSQLEKQQHNNQPNEQQNNNHSTTDPPRSKIYYWGVQVTLPVFTDNLSSNINTSTFRIVTMGDGLNDEIESCWWNVDFRSLNHSVAPLTAPPIVDRNSPYSPIDPEIIPPLIAISQNSERNVLGLSQSDHYIDQNYKPIQIISFVTWKNYILALSSSLGIFMLDVIQPSSQTPFTTQWISFLPKRSDLMDFAIFGNNLILTLPTGHLVWSFYGKTKSPYFNPKDLGLQSTSTQ